MQIDVIVADITTLALDAIVNAANTGLLGGGGVDGAIHRAAGPALQAACRALPEQSPGVRCPTGDARITGGFALPARHVIHTVGPVWRGGFHDEAALLRACHDRSLQLAADAGCREIAFPAISCGVYRYPPDAAAGIAVAALRDWRAALPVRVVLCCFDAAMAQHFHHALQNDP